MGTETRRPVMAVPRTLSLLSLVRSVSSRGLAGAAASRVEVIEPGEIYASW